MNSPSYEEPPVDFNDLARELVEILRIESDLNYTKCQSFADLVVTMVHERLRLPDLLPLIEALRKVAYRTIIISKVAICFLYQSNWVLC